MNHFFIEYTFLQLIGLENIRVILRNADVNVVIDGDSMNASDEKFENVNLLLKNNDNAINAIARFFYEEKII